MTRASAFDEWWTVYPHKVAKADAKRAFENAGRKAPLETLIASVERYIAGKPADRPYCNPATWLNGERWLDQPSVAGPTRKAGNETGRQMRPPTLGELAVERLHQIQTENGLALLLDHE